MKRGILIAIILILTLLLGCSPKTPMLLSPTEEATSPAPQETPAPSPITYTLTVTAAPSNGGSINLSPAGGTYTRGTTVTLTATPASGYNFGYWDGAASGSSRTVTIIMGKNKSTTAHFKAAPAPTTTPTLSPTLTGPYTGPLFDTHLHLRGIQNSWSAERLLSYFDRRKVDWAIGFYVSSADTSSGVVSRNAPIIKGAESRVIPLLMPQDGVEVGRWSQFISGQFSEAVLRQYLQPQGLLWGVGEIGLSEPPLQSVTFDSPAMQTVFQVVNDLKGIVMVHLSSVKRGGRPTELSEVEPSIRKYPDAIFLFHGKPEVFNLVVQLISKYPNVYFTFDAKNWYFHSDVLGRNVLDDNDNAESFLADVNRIGSDRLLKEGFAQVAPLLQQYPDRIFWGTDLGPSWQFEEPVTDMVIEVTRQFIARLPADIREKYAYKNAQRVFGRFLTPNP